MSLIINFAGSIFALVCSALLSSTANATVNQTIWKHCNTCNAYDMQLTAEGAIPDSSTTKINHYNVYVMNIRHSIIEKYKVTGYYPFQNKRLFTEVEWVGVNAELTSDFNTLSNRINELEASLNSLPDMPIPSNILVSSFDLIHHSHNQLLAGEYISQNLHRLEFCANIGAGLSLPVGMFNTVINGLASTVTVRFYDNSTAQFKITGPNLDRLIWTYVSGTASDADKNIIPETAGQASPWAGTYTNTTNATIMSNFIGFRYFGANADGSDGKFYCRSIVKGGKLTLICRSTN